MKKLEQLLNKGHKIACLLTTYEEDLGNCTRIIFDCREDLLLKQTVNSTLNSIARFYNIDLKEVRRKQQKLLNCRYYTPLPLREDLLFIPIKTRLPLVKKDPSLSYINFYSIKNLDRKSPILHLNNKRSIKSLNSLNIVKKRYNQGEISAQFSKQTLSSQLVEEKTLAYYPATKADIKLLAKELNDLRDILKGILRSSEDQRDINRED